MRSGSWELREGEDAEESGSLWSSRLDQILILKPIYET